MQYQAYLTNVSQQVHRDKFLPLSKDWKELLSYLYKLILRKGSKLIKVSEEDMIYI